MRPYDVKIVAGDVTVTGNVLAESSKAAVVIVTLMNADKLAGVPLDTTDITFAVKTRAEYCPAVMSDEEKHYEAMQAELFANYALYKEARRKGISIHVKTGGEGPSHDPYGYTEVTVSQGGLTIIVHEGLASWWQVKGQDKVQANSDEEHELMNAKLREHFGHTVDQLIDMDNARFNAEEI